MRVNTFVFGSLLITTAVGCSASGGSGPAASSSQGGGNLATGGATTSSTGTSLGGINSTGGAPTVGGTQATGGTANVTTGGHAGANATGGALPATGGKASTGGSSTAGGNNSTGGVPLATGGKSATGGSVTGGGVSATGGASSTGGSKPAGGASATGGAPTAMGGSSATGGTTAQGGASSTCGYKGVPNSQNTTNFDPGAWYTSWKSKFYTDCGNGMARVANGQGSGNTVSEGMGYGMLMAVGSGDRTAFDAFWAFYKGHVDVNGLMNWSVNNCTTQAPGSSDNFAATDGDEDAAMALVQADAKWGGYTTDAKKLIGLIKQYETSSTTTPTYLRPGDAANNGGKGEGIVNPSYFAPGYWHVWATYTGDTFWNQLATDAYGMLAKYQALTISNSTGALVPDWGNSAGQNPYGSSYYYDACRTPWRVAVDYVWFCTASAQTFLQNVSAYVDARGGVASVPFDKNSAFFGPFALSGMAVSQTKATEYLNGWLSAQMDDTPYFQGSLRGVFLLLANLNFSKGI